MSARQSAAMRAVATGGMMLATTMNSLDSTIANVSLPHIQGSLSAGQDRPQRGNVGDGTAHRADRVERGAEREDAVDRDVPEPRLESDRLTGG